jgi:hypothetical protein
MARREPPGLIKLCPTKCNGGYAYNQRKPYEGELANIPTDNLWMVKGSLKYCTYCQAVYEDRGSYKRLLGFLEGDKFEERKGIVG